MHGWCCDSLYWDRWKNYFEENGWQWDSNERGYGRINPINFKWYKNNKNSRARSKEIIIAHSLGFHLIEEETLQKASAIILINSFGKFVSKEKSDRKLKLSLKIMLSKIGSENEYEMIKNFHSQATSPNKICKTNSNIMKTGLTNLGRAKLKEDINYIINCKMLPKGINKNTPFLIIEGEEDLIISDSARSNLRSDLTNHLKIHPTIWSIENEGHFISESKLLKAVKDWIETI